MTPVVPLMGLETEYGIIREDLEKSDPVDESMALLKCCPFTSAFGSWAYSREQAHKDQRGYTVRRLAQDEEEDEFCAEDEKRPFSYLEMKSDRVLVNGARFYNDHTHPEYATPECRSVFQLVAHDLAGDRIVQDCVRIRNKELGNDGLQVFKNNTDYSGHSYGTHDNYLIPRELSFDTWVEGLIPFLITRQLYAGAGKVGSEARLGMPHYGLQLSQRADFIESQLSIETMTNRPIINTRDEAHASERKYRRLHLILGDANMSPYATALKVGTTQMVLSLIGEEKLGKVPMVQDPVAAIKEISYDLTGTRTITSDAGKLSSLDIQAIYLEQAAKQYQGQNDDWDWVLKEWERTLTELKTDPAKLADRIDWAIKKKLFEQFIKTEGLTWEDPWLKSVDLEYHNLDPERGLYYGLEQENEIYRFMNEEDVACARKQGPEGSRARIRGKYVEKQSARIKRIHWTGIEFENGDTVDLSDIISTSDVEEALNKI